MKIEDKKQTVLNVIFERAAELEAAAIEFLQITTKAENINYSEVSDSALKKAFQEWKENKPVFNLTSK